MTSRNTQESSTKSISYTNLVAEEDVQSTAVGGAEAHLPPGVLEHACPICKVREDDAEIQGGDQHPAYGARCKSWVLLC